jgi:ATP-binding cassette subfamily B protein
VRRPRVYLFDDCFSALDYSTDAALRQALAYETQGSTILVVAQRISTITQAERIVILDDGRVAGAGSHDELVRDNVVYQEIVRSQLGEEAR